jgi:hypothetical protein
MTGATDVEFSVSVPLDADGFLRRDCPTCQREFKWFEGRTEDTPDNWEDPEQYFCPYCGVPADTDSWFTQAQAAYIEQTLSAHASDLFEDELDDIARGINRQGGPIRMSVSGGARDTAPPPPLSEPNDMVAVASPCHPFEPVKVLDVWGEPLHCLVCGSAFTLG